MVSGRAASVMVSVNAERKRMDGCAKCLSCVENIFEYFTGCGAKTMERKRIW